MIPSFVLWCEWKWEQVIAVVEAMGEFRGFSCYESLACFDVVRSDGRSGKVNSRLRACHMNVG